MSKWERFMFNRTPHSSFAEESLLRGSPGMQDAVSEELIDKVANNGDTEKRLLAKIYLENNAAHVEINNKLAICATKTGFHDKFIWTCIGVLITGFIGGMIVLIIELAKHMAGG